MEVRDKRLVERWNTVEQEKYNKEMLKHIPDATEKYEEIEIEHETINLLKKLKDKINDKPEDPFSLETSENSNET